MASLIKKVVLIFCTTISIASGVFLFQVLNTQRMESTPVSTPIFEDSQNGQLATDNDLTIEGEFRLVGSMFLDKQNIETGVSNGKVLSVNELGKIVLVNDEMGEALTTVVNNITNTTSTTTQTIDTPFVFLDDDVGGSVGLGLDLPSAKFHIRTEDVDKIGLIVQGQDDQSEDLSVWQNDLGQNLVRFTADGKILLDNSASHQLELRPSGNMGYLSSSGGSMFIENTNNLGTGIGIYSNAGADALGNMINVKVDNPLYNQAAFYMNYDGLSNAVEIVSNTEDTSSNALSVTGYNTSDSTVGIIGYESGRGTLKISHNKPSSSDANASGISIDLKGTGTAAQGLYIDSTATGGTSGNLLRLRNETLDRFVVSSTGSLTIGRNGTNSSVTKNGNTVGDEFFIGTNGAFRVQRSATDSEAFRTQVVGDSQGRWLGTSDGKLKFGGGSATQDVVLQRTGVGLFQLDADVYTSGNLGIGTGTFDATADKVITFTNGTAPAASIADGVQLWAEDVTASSELRVRDEANNITTLSPHNFSLIPEGESEDMAWAYYSQKNDIAINADMTKALRLLEELTGETLIYKQNLLTGESISVNKDINSKTDYFADASVDLKILDLAVSRQEFEKHVSWVDGIWNFIADINFKGHIGVSADTAGDILVIKGTRRFRVNFSKNYTNTPIVYVSTNSDVRYKLENTSQSGFEIVLESPLVEDTNFKWFALSSESNSSNFEILEKSE